MNNIINICIIVICLVFSAYFSATETAFSSLDKIKLKNKVKEGNKRAIKTLELVEHYDNMLSTVLVGNNIVNILSASIGTIVCVNIFGETLGPTLSTVILTVVVLIFGEISPKTIAKEYPLEFAMFSTSILNILIVLLKPITVIFSLWKKVLEKFFKKNKEDGITEAEISTIVEESNIDNEEKDLLQNVIEFNNLQIGEIYTPRVDMISISKDTTRETIKNVFIETAYSRLPVFDKTIDNIIGVLNYKDFTNKDKDIVEILQPVIFVLKKHKAKEVLQKMQKSKSHLAIVVNEYSETIGLVTLEDLLEELVGEIWDEHDIVDRKVDKINDNEYEVSGFVELYVLEELCGLELGEDLNTVNGWIMNNLGKLPQEGDIVNYQNLQLEVLSVNNKRVDKFKVFLNKN